MCFSFKNILIPVDFSINTKVAVLKGIELASKDSTIHLLHVQRYSFPALNLGPAGYWINMAPFQSPETVLRKLAQWKSKIIREAGDIKVAIWINGDESVQKAIQSRTQELQADLVIVGKKRYYSWFTWRNSVIPGDLLTESGAAILTVRPASINSRIRTMIVPASSGLSVCKKEIISFICKKFKLKVHLVSFRNENFASSDFNASGLLQLYQWLKTSGQCQVEHTVLGGVNHSKAILDYAEQVSADILLVHPHHRNKLNSVNSHIFNKVPTSSKLQILAI